MRNRHRGPFQLAVGLVVNVVRLHLVGVAHAVEDRGVVEGGLAASRLADQLEGSVADLAIDVVARDAADRVDVAAEANGAADRGGQHAVVR